MEIENNYYPITISVEPTEVDTGDTSVRNIRPNTGSVPLSDSNIVSSPDGSVMTSRLMRSPNYSYNNSGWRIDSNGDIEANNGIFRGTFEIGGAVKTIQDVADLQTALDDIYTDGGGTVYLKAGTYTLTADITIPSGVVLEGVSRDSVIIDCNTSYAVKIAGTNVYSTGTVTINNGETSVIGSSTVWTAAMVGRYILLDGLWYEILTRVSNTEITIDAYQGVNLAGGNYVLADTNFTGQLRKVTVQNATGSALIIQYASEPTIFDVNVFDSGTGIDMDYVVFPILQVTSDYNTTGLNMNFVEGFYLDFSEFNFNTGNGVTMTSSRNATFFNSSCNDNGGNGVSITDGSKIAIISLDISGNSGKGLEFVSGCNDNQITDAVFDGNTSDGLKLTATSDRNAICQISVTNNGGYGVNIAASTCDNNIINAPSFLNNTSGNVNDLGTGTSVLPELTKYYTAGMALTAGQIVFYHTDGKVYSGDATYNNTTDKSFGVCLANTANGALAPIQSVGEAGGFSGLTVASAYYLQNATHTIDQQNTTTTGAGKVLNTVEEVYQSFTTGNGIVQLTKIALELSTASGGGESITIKLREGTGIAGNLVATLTATGPAPSAATWINFLTIPITLTANTIYSISVYSNGADTSITGANNNPYAGGRNDQSATYDYAFKTYYSTGRGALGTSAGTVSKLMGFATTTTKLQLNYQIT